MAWNNLNQLATVDQIKQFLQNGGNDPSTNLDTYWSDLSTRATTQIEKWTNRHFPSTTYWEWATINTPTYLPKEFPITSFMGAWSQTGTAFTFANSTTNLISATVNVNQTGIALSTLKNDGTATSDSITFATNTTSQNIVSQINGFSTNGWSATKVTDCLYNFIVPATYSNTNNSVQMANQAIPAIWDVGSDSITVSPPSYIGYNFPYSGNLYNGCGGAGYVLLNYTAGYASPPSDLTEACCQLVQMYNQTYNSSKQKDWEIVEWTKIKQILRPYKRFGGF